MYFEIVYACLWPVHKQCSGGQCVISQTFQASPTASWPVCVWELRKHAQTIHLLQHFHPLPYCFSPSLSPSLSPFFPSLIHTHRQSICCSTLLPSTPSPYCFSPSLSPSLSPFSPSLIHTHRQSICCSTLLPSTPSPIASLLPSLPLSVLPLTHSHIQTERQPRHESRGARQVHHK